MSRPIKFKVYVESVLPEESGVYVPEYISGFSHDLGIDKVYTKEYKFTSDTCKFTLLQYTGLKDKNGVEIYEGDIVTWHNKYFEYNNPRQEFKGQIKYDTAHFAIFTLDGTWDNSDWIGAITEVEVIGNVWENKELLSDTPLSETNKAS